VPIIQPPAPKPSISIPTPAPAAGPSVRTIAIVAGLASVVSVLGSAAVVGAILWGVGAFGPSAPAATDFVAAGKAYGKVLAPTYAATWKSYAADIRAGKTFTESTKTFADNWKTNRDAIYKKYIIPELSKVMPDGTPDDQVTPAQRAALAAAADDLAKGLESAR
jgi:hypothetical protein